MIRITAIIVLSTAFICNFFVHGTSITDTKKLYNAKLAGYDTRIRPRTDQADTVLVASEFIPTNIIEFETTEQRFTVLGYLELTWTDEVLQWDTLKFGGVDAIKVPIDDLWTPSVILGKAFEGSGVIGDSASDIATVTNKGLVKWSPEGTFSFVCEVDIKYYPFDEQLCTLTYYVSDETVHSVNLSHNKTVSLAKFIQNSEWDLVEVEKTVDYKYDANFINIHFKVQRRASFTTYTVITPLLMLAFLNVCVFLVPIDSGEKGSFAITIFLSYGIFVTIVSDTLPHNSLQISYFVLFLIVLLLLSVLSVFYTIMQAKVFAVYADQVCTFRLCCRKKPKSNNEIQQMETDDNIFVIQPVDCKMNVEDIEHKQEGAKSEDEDTNELDKDKKEEKEEKSPTWRSFLEKLDTCLFLAFFTLVTAATVVFFALMMQRFGINKMHNIKL